MSRDILDTERPFHTEHFIQLLEQSEDPQDVLNDVVQMWLSDGTDTGDKGDLYFKFHKDGDPGENASHKLLDFDGNVFADGYMFADKANVGGIVAAVDGTTALDMIQGNVFTCTPAENTSWSTSAPTNGIGGELASFVVDNAGGYTVAWAAGFTDVDSIGAGDTGISTRLLQFDGTTWHQIASTEDGVTTNAPVGGSSKWRFLASRNFLGPASAGTSLIVTNEGNFFAGENAGEDFHTGDFNTFIGTDAALNALQGNGNIAIGGRALDSLDGSSLDALHNIGIGLQAGLDLEAGHADIFIGYKAGHNVNYGDDNIVIGEEALGQETIGDGNIAIGVSAMSITTEAHYNVAIGELALQSGVPALSGEGNVALGAWAGRNLEGASDGNIYLGYVAGPSSDTVQSDMLYIHNDDGVPLIGGDMSNDRVGIVVDPITLSNILEVKQTSATDPIADNWTTYPSDRKHKDIISDSGDLLETFKKIKTYRYKRKPLVSDVELNREAGKRIKFMLRDEKDKDKKKELLSKRSDIGIFLDVDALRTELVDTKSQLPKYKAERVGISVDDPEIPEEILVLGETGEVEGIDLLGYIGYLHSVVKELAMAIAA